MHRKPKANFDSDAKNINPMEVFHSTKETSKKVLKVNPKLISYGITNNPVVKWIARFWTVLFIAMLISILVISLANLA